MKLFKILFENKQPRMSLEQAKIIKELYTSIRDVLLTIKKDLESQQIPKNDILQMNKFIHRIYNPSQDVLKKVSKQDKYFLLQISPEYSQVFPDLENGLVIGFKNGTGMEIGSGGGGKKRLLIGIDSFFNEPELNNNNIFKSQLQHELQHLVDTEGNVFTGERNDISHIHDYLSTDGEIGAHAKQFAYLYRKSFPKDTVIDQNKLKPLSDQLENENYGKNFSWYIIFGTPAETLVEQYQISKELANEFNQTYSMYINTIKEYFEYFIKKL